MFSFPQQDFFFFVLFWFKVFGFVFFFVHTKILSVPLPTFQSCQVYFHSMVLRLHLQYFVGKQTMVWINFIKQFCKCVRCSCGEKLLDLPFCLLVF